MTTYLYGNGACEGCGASCQVFGCRWCPACYDAASAALRAQHRVRKAQTPAEWAAAFKPLTALASIGPPVPWQREALGVLSRPVPSTLLGLPLVIDRALQASSVVLWSARPGRTPAQVRAVCLLLDDMAGEEVPPC